MEQKNDDHKPERGEPIHRVDTSAQTGMSSMQRVLAAASIGLGLYAVWQIAPSLPVVGPLISQATAPTNLLEEAATLGRSTRADFTKFVDAGGLDVYRSWHGLNVQNIETSYDSNGLLVGVALLATGTAKWNSTLSKWVMDDQVVTPAKAREVLTSACRTTDWKVGDTGGAATATNPNGAQLQCAYNRWSAGAPGLLLTLAVESKKQPQSATSSPTSEPGTTPTAQPVTLHGNWVCGEGGEQRPTVFFEDGTFIFYSAQDTGNDVFASGIYRQADGRLEMVRALGRVVKQSTGEELVAWRLNRAGQPFSQTNFRWITYSVHVSGKDLRRSAIKVSTGPGGEEETYNAASVCTRTDGFEHEVLKAQRNAVPSELYSQLRATIGW
jgi:hypothetical protein